MRLVVFGAGAVGGVLGGLLHEAGHDVRLVARGAHFEAVQAHGLTIESADRRVTLPVPVFTDPSAAGASDAEAVLLCVKGQDTATALAALVEAGARDVPLVCVQNGIANEPVALRVFADVYGVCVMFPTSHLTPGVVQQNSSPVPGLLDVGRFPSGVDPATEALAAAFVSGGFESEPRDDIMRWKAAKLLMNLGNSAQALCGAIDGLGDLVRAARTEGMAALDAAGVAYVSDEEDRARRGDLLTMKPIGDQPRGGGSSWQSLVRGTGAIETDYLNGEIVLLGRLHGVPTPVNTLLQRLAAEAASSGAQPGSYTPAELLELAGL
ncbi:MAG TPA: 2-dehydropantoate 2-reductase N-terminal domain-containing protein [Acidimicrobiales bacterium]|nr:2-dehydropantoate 2-reductase N-terminal domain-containing protein [Acidimicrobiales bacterium]